MKSRGVQKAIAYTGQQEEIPVWPGSLPGSSRGSSSWSEKALIAAMRVPGEEYPWEDCFQNKKEKQEAQRTPHQNWRLRVSHGCVAKLASFICLRICGCPLTWRYAWPVTDTDAFWTSLYGRYYTPDVSLSYHVSHHPEAAGPNRMVGWPIEN